MLQNLKALFGLAIVGGVVYVGAMVGPHYFAFYQFKDDVASAAKFGSTSEKSDTEIRDEVLAKANQYKISLREEQVLVTRDGRDVTIKAKYKEVVEFVGGKRLVLNFDASATDKPKPVPGG